MNSEFGGIIEVNPSLFGSIVVKRAPASDSEGRYRMYGYRPAMPLLVYSMSVRSLPVAGLPANGSFVVSASYVPAFGDGMYAYGAQANSIGSVFASGTGTVTVFRSPRLAEVVWSTNPTGGDNGLFRWDGQKWAAYQPGPQRSFNSQRVFDATDPDGVFNPYLARLIGAMQSQISADNYSLLDFLDPNKAPDDYLGLLGSEFGVTVPSSEDLSVQRQAVQTSL